MSRDHSSPSGCKSPVPNGTRRSAPSRVFINQCCMLYDMAGVDIADDVMIGPNVNIITSGHPLELSKRRAHVEAKPIAIEKNVWIAAGATILGGVIVGEISVVAAGAVVTKDVPPEQLGGNCIFKKFDLAQLADGCRVSRFVTKKDVRTEFQPGRNARRFSSEISCTGAP